MNIPVIDFRKDPICKNNNGVKIWSIDGVRHRIDGPALEWPNGLKAYYSEGLCHRLDGPAIINEHAIMSWFYKGYQLPGDAINSWIIQNEITIPFNLENQIKFNFKWIYGYEYIN